MAIYAWEDTCRVSLAVVTPHLTWMGPSMCTADPNTEYEARVLATSQMAVSSAPPAYPPNMGIYPWMAGYTALRRPATELMHLESTLSSLRMEHLWRSVASSP